MVMVVRIHLKQFPSPLEVTWVINAENGDGYRVYLRFPSPLEVTWVINRNSMIIIDKINVFPSPLEVTWVINHCLCP